MLTWLKKLSTLRRSGPDLNASNFKKRADEHLRRDELDAAAMCYRRALSINTEYVDACIGLGFVLLEQRQYGEAHGHLTHALSLDPDIADVHYLLGRLCQEQDGAAGDAPIAHFTRALELKPDLEVAYRALYFALAGRDQIEPAKALLSKAIAAFPASAEFQGYLGQLLDREGRYDDAVACYERALVLQPDAADLHYILGETHRKRGDLAAASTSFRKALTLNPDLAAAHLSFGIVLEGQGKIDDAIGSYMRAVALNSEFTAAHHHLGNAYMQKSATRQAISCFREVVRLEPQSGVAHLIEALSGTSSERAPSGYVEKLFDEYADRFDSHLVHALKYSVPEQLAGLLQAHAWRNVEKWDVLDLGCGTGLAGVAISAYARQLVGVDLSAKMLEKAAARNLYRRLERLDLIAMMKLEAANSYDVVIAADVLVYIGRLDELVDQLRRLLRPQGLFAFSVESLDALAGADSEIDMDRDFRLTQTGRYAHSADYLRAIALDQGFDVLKLIDAQGRVDKGRAVQHYLGLWRLSSMVV